ncbi:MAG: hypothetical protein GY751_18205 [Bacteroidetes bacterium]|nr:hypothetical protein [Bacteroidota bacterium]
MTKEEQFIEALKSNVKEGNEFPSIIQAVVVEAGDTFCKVKLTDNDLELEEVMYSATEENENGFILIPKENTNVLIGTIGGDENSLYILAMDEVQKVKLVIEGETLIIDKDGFNMELSNGKVTVKNSTSDLKQLLTDMVDMVMQLRVSTAVGASGTPLPPTITQANGIKNSINGLFN